MLPPLACFVPSYCQDFWAFYSFLIKSKLQSYHMSYYSAFNLCPAYGDARLMRQRTPCLVLLSSSQQTPSLGSPETHPGRDVRADTNGGSTTLGHPMWKRPRKLLPETFYQWSGETNRKIEAYTAPESLTLSSCFIHFIIWLSCFSLFAWSHMAVLLQPFYVILSDCKINFWSRCFALKHLFLVFAAFWTAWLEIWLYMRFKLVVLLTSCILINLSLTFGIYGSSDSLLDF